MSVPIDPSTPLIIVGIGASAGGLEAIQGFLERLPDQQRMTFVIVQHLDPDHDSPVPYTHLTLPTICTV